MSAPAHYNLGTALTVARRLDEAADEYRARCGSIRRTRTRTTTSGTSTSLRKSYDEAIREFTEAVRLQPDSASAQRNLAAAKAAAQRREWQP